MATGTNVKKPCCKCNKGGATFTCDGCHRSFCLKHASDHRQELSQQIDNIGQQHDILIRDLSVQDINKTLLNRINRWEDESIAKIHQSADTARTDLKRLTKQSNDRLTDLMSKLSDELRSNRENDDYTEQDLTRWMDQLEEFRKELQKPSEFTIVEDKSSFFHLIEIKQTNVVGKDSIKVMPQRVVHSAEKFSEVIGPLLLSENGYSMTSISKLDFNNRFSSSCGIVLYSSDVHHLEFSINTSHDSAVFFGIIPSSDTLVNQTSTWKSAYGCWSRGGPVTRGVWSIKHENIETLPDDEVMITLDCSARQVSYFHKRTGKCCKVGVDELICPLPWKLVVTLWHPDDKIRILKS